MNCYEKWEPLNKEVENKREGPAGSHGEREIRERASTRKCFINYYCSHLQYTCEQSNAMEIERPGKEYADMLRSRNRMLVTCIQDIIIVINCYIIILHKDKGQGARTKLHKNIIIGIETESNITHNMTCPDTLAPSYMYVSLAVVHEPGAVAVEAEYRKTLKYGVLPSSYSFIHIVVET